jgi:hypothetical protein
MGMTINKSILEKMDEIITLLPKSDIKTTLETVMKSKADKFAVIENVETVHNSVSADLIIS